MQVVTVEFRDGDACQVMRSAPDAVSLTLQTDREGHPLYYEVRTAGGDESHFFPFDAVKRATWLLVSDSAPAEAA